MIISQLLSRRSVPLPLPLNASIVCASVRATEWLIIGTLVNIITIVFIIAIEIILAEKLMIWSFLNSVILLITLAGSFLNLVTAVCLLAGSRARREILLDPIDDLRVVWLLPSNWSVTSSLHLLQGRPCTIIATWRCGAFPHLATTLHLVQISALLVADTGTSEASWRVSTAIVRVGGSVKILGGGLRVISDRIVPAFHLLHVDTW